MERECIHWVKQSSDPCISKNTQAVTSVLPYLTSLSLDGIDSYIAKM